MKLTEAFKEILVAITDQSNTLKSLPTQKDSPKTQYPTTVVPDNRRAPPWDSGHSVKIGGTWNLKHDISSPEFYELLTKT